MHIKKNPVIDLESVRTDGVKCETETRMCTGIVKDVSTNLIKIQENSIRNEEKC